MRVYPRQQDDACTQSLRLAKLITCVMSSCTLSETATHRLPLPKPLPRLPEHRSCGTPELLALAAPGACRCTTTGISTAPKNCTGTAGFLGFLHTVGTRLCSTTRMVQQAEDELSLRHLQLELVDCWNLSPKSTRTSTTGTSTVCCTVAPAASASALSPTFLNRRKAAYAADKASPASSSQSHQTPQPEPFDESSAGTGGHSRTRLEEYLHTFLGRGKLRKKP